MRMFVALVPPPGALEDLAEFLEPRQEAEPGFRWTVPEQWHVTLAFMPDVADRHLDDLVDRLTRAAARRTTFPVALVGGGAFPDPSRAKVLFAGVGADSVELGRLATGARAYRGPTWQAADVALFASYLGEGPRRRPRHEVVDTFRLRPLPTAVPDTLSGPGLDPRSRKSGGNRGVTG